MRRLDRYILRDFLLYSLMGVVFFVGVFLIVDSIERIDTFVDNKTPFPLVVRYYLWNLPVFLIQVVPLAILLGAMLSLGQLRRWNEITAMQGVGRSPIRIAIPMILAGLVVAAASFGMSELLVPTAYRSQTRILKVEIKGQQSEDSMGRLNVRFLGEGGVFWMIEYYDGATKSLRNVSIQSLTRTGLAQRIDAETATWDDGLWTFLNGHARVFQDSVESAVRFRRLVTSGPREAPESFSRLSENPFQMNMPDLKRYAQKVRASGSRDTKIWVDYHLRLSFPFATVIMVLLGASLSLRIVRGSHLALGIGATLFLGFAYWTLLRAGQSLGYAGALPPPVAAWLANIVFGAIGLVLFWKVAR